MPLKVKDRIHPPGRESDPQRFGSATRWRAVDVGHKTDLLLWTKDLPRDH